MRHLMPIVTPRLILRPPTLRDLDSIQTAKEEAWPDLQRWMSWAFDNQRIAASDGRFNSANDGLPESSRNRVGRIP
jgi:hypothetical protein